MQGGEKNKKPEGGVFHRQNGCQKIRFYKCYDICFLNIYEKHPLIGKNCIQSLKKKILQISQLFFGCCRVVRYLIFQFTFIFYEFYWFLR